MKWNESESNWLENDMCVCCMCKLSLLCTFELGQNLNCFCIKFAFLAWKYFP